MYTQRHGMSDAFPLVIVGFADVSSVTRVGSKVYFTLLAPLQDSRNRQIWDSGINKCIELISTGGGTHDEISLPVDQRRTEIRVTIDVGSVALSTRMGFQVIPEHLEERLMRSTNCPLKLTLLMVYGGPRTSWRTGKRIDLSLSSSRTSYAHAMTDITLTTRAARDPDYAGKDCNSRQYDWNTEPFLDVLSRGSGRRVSREPVSLGIIGSVRLEASNVGPLGDYPMKSRRMDQACIGLVLTRPMDSKLQTEWDRAIALFREVAALIEGTVSCKKFFNEEEITLSRPVFTTTNSPFNNRFLWYTEDDSSCIQWPVPVDEKFRLYNLLDRGLRPLRTALTGNHRDRTCEGLEPLAYVKLYMVHRVVGGLDHVEGVIAESVVDDQ
ncbi:hypothetical protein NP233_g9307 [Leucocoprinus birnbaumii]|uniref:Uncharacterized protein n=1 Tax=Leucocoprinus birnbaumii TaxID=56174 RepID=A0AAD5VKZ5_9AGAR|nr:hypothetical protein NP233_g9307 [Leucocoprinus birnbaumii]